MKKLSILAAAALVAGPAFAFINQMAVGASSDLADASEELHHYMHHHYPSSYGSHGMDDASADLRDNLTLWDLGAATECEVIPYLDGVDLAFADMTMQFNENGLMSVKETKKEYKKVQQDYALMAAFTAAARCPGASAAKVLKLGSFGSPTL